MSAKTIRRAARPLARTLGHGAAFAVVAAAAMAAAAQPVERLERVVVTGSNLPRAEAEAAQPLQVLTRDDIERSGRTSLAEVLQGLTANNSGSLPAAFTAGTARGGAGLSLRGLGVQSTLVLVNGRRMAAYGLADDAQRSFVDLSSLPLEAVERIEVLKDGASAVYGSDAIGGVVNVILRKRFTGFALATDAGASYRGDGEFGRVAATWGNGDGDGERGGPALLVSGEYSKSRAIAQRTRRSYLGTDRLDTLPATFGYHDQRLGGTSPASGLPLTRTPYGSVADPATRLYRPATTCPETIAHPGGNVLCAFDGIRYAQVQPEVERFNLVGRGEWPLGGDLRGTIEAGVFATRTAWQRAPTPLSAGWAVARDQGFVDNFALTLPVGHPDNPFAAPARFRTLTANAGQRAGAQENAAYRLVAGVGGAVRAWQVDAAVGVVGTRLNDTTTGYLRNSVLVEGLASGQFRLGFTPLDAVYLARLAPPLQRTATSRIAFADLKASRELMALPGGPLGLAAGAEVRRETSRTPALPYTFEGDIVGVGYSAFDASRGVVAVFGELNAPLSKTFELSAALRHDRYSDYGASTTPKLGFRFAPLPALALRGGYSEGFRAPGPAENGRSTNAVYVGYLNLTLGNPALRPETSRHATLGLVFTPARDSRLSIDFYRVVRSGEITGADAAFVVGAGQQQGAPLATVVGRQAGSKIVYDEDGRIAAVIAPYFNGGRTVTRGVDVEARQRFMLPGAGRLTARLMWTHVASLAREVDGMTFEYAGTHGPFALGSAGGTPKDRAVADLTWEHEGLAATLRANFVSGMKAIDHTGAPYDPLGTELGAVPPGATTPCGAYFPDGRPAPNADCRVASFTTFDVIGRWRVSRHVTLTGAVTNLLNRLAPWDPYTYGAANYDSAWHQDGAVGRFVKVGLRVAF